MKNKGLIFIVIVLLGLGLIWFSDTLRDEGSDLVDETNGDSVVGEPPVKESISPTPNVFPTLSVSPTPSESQYPKIVNKYPPAECSLAGSIEYIEPGIYENKEATITYKNIDSIARHIIWTVFPQDDLSVGPNLFANLPVPDGSDSISAGLPAEPVAKNYTLTAKVTYGVFVKGNLEMRQSVCSGQILVKINY